MPYTIKLRRMYVTVAIVSWLLLLLNILLLDRSIQTQTTSFSFPYLNSFLSVTFILAIFLYQRTQAEHLRGLDFTEWLWQLFISAGVAGYLVYFLWLGYDSVYENGSTIHPYLFDVYYQVAFGIMVFFLAKAFYVWRALVLYQKTKPLQAEWHWFEILLLSTLVFPQKGRGNWGL